MPEDPRHLSGRVDEADVRRPDETWESIPWDSLLQTDRGERRWLVYAGVALLVVLAAGGAATVLFRDPPPTIVESVTTPEVTTPEGTAPVEPMAAPTIVETPTSSTEAIDDADDGWLTEADLMAAPTAIETEAAGAASWFLHDFLTRDVTPDRPGGVHVEAIVVLATNRNEIDTTTVRLAARTLGTTDGTTWLRRPDVVYDVVVTTSSDGPLVLGVPLLVEGPAVTIEVPDETVEIARSRTDAAVRALGRGGVVDDRSVATLATAAGTIVVADVTDDVGLVWRIGFLVEEASAAG